MAWLLRAAGFLLMWLGFGLTLNPLRVLADLLPFLGRVVGAVGGMLSFLLAAILSAVVIVISWLFVRPLLVISVLAAGLGIFMLIGQLRARKQSPAPQDDPGGDVPTAAPGE